MKFKLVVIVHAPTQKRRQLMHACCCTDEKDRIRIRTFAGFEILASGHCHTSNNFFYKLYKYVLIELWLPGIRENLRCHTSLFTADNLQRRCFRIRLYCRIMYNHVYVDVDMIIHLWLHTCGRGYDECTIIDFRSPCVGITDSEDSPSEPR